MGFANVVIIEDDHLTRTLLTVSLEAAGFIVVAAGSKAKIALDAQARQSVDVAILDLDLGAGPSGIDIAYALREANPAIGLVLLTSFSDPRLSATNGVKLPKGTRYLTKSTVKEMSKVLSVILQAKHAPLDASAKVEVANLALTPQQITVIRLVASGATNGEIGRQLGITDKAVEHLIARINENLGLNKSSSVNSRVQLVRKFAELTGGQLP